MRALAISRSVSIFLDDELVFVFHAFRSAISGFDWEEGSTPAVTSANLASRAQTFVSEAMKRAAAYRTSHLLVPYVLLCLLVYCSCCEC